jgi:hypothetical protein
MNTNSRIETAHTAGRRRAAVWLSAALAAAAWAAPIQAQSPVQPATQLDFPVSSPGVPAYARLELLLPEFDVPNNEAWAAIVFYRDPACVPPDFNLGQFFHFPGPDGPGAFGCRLLVEGHEIWQNGPGQDPAPVYVRTRNAVPDLPVWFVASEDLSPLLQSGHVSIGDVAALPSLLKGSAQWFEEALYPNGAAPDPGITLRANGRLATGGTFDLAWHFHARTRTDEVTIRLELPPRSHRRWPVACRLRAHLCEAR